MTAIGLWHDLMTLTSRFLLDEGMTSEIITALTALGVFVDPIIIEVGDNKKILTYETPSKEEQ